MLDRTTRQLMTVLLLFFSAGLMHAAGIYKWVDAEGNVHYGEQPPPSGAREMHIRSAGGTDEHSEADSGSAQHDHRAQRDKMIQALEGDRLARKEKKQKQQEAMQKRKMQCARARDTLRQYQRAASLYKLDADGNRHTLPDAVKQQETRRLQSEIKQWCK